MAQLLAVLYEMYKTANLGRQVLTGAPGVHAITVPGDNIKKHCTVYICVPQSVEATFMEKSQRWNVIQRRCPFQIKMVMGLTKTVREKAKLSSDDFVF